MSFIGMNRGIFKGPFDFLADGQYGSVLPDGFLKQVYHFIAVLRSQDQPYPAHFRNFFRLPLRQASRNDNGPRRVLLLYPADGIQALLIP